MNAPTKPKVAQSVAGELKAMDAENAKMRIWNALGKTDPAHTKQFSRAGGFKGTAIKPIWITQRLTELFGPCGTGWGFEKPDFQLVEAAGEVLVYCTVTAWYIDPNQADNPNALSKTGRVYGVGGDKVVAKRQSGLFTDDEAYKKAFTDALGNAFKFVGIGADVHMGLFDDSKYVAEVREQFHPKPDVGTGETPPAKRVALDGPYTSATALKTAAREFVRTLEGIGDLDEFIAWSETTDYREFCDQLAKDMPDWWMGGASVPAEFVPLEIRIRQRREDLEKLEGVR
jgi:hypothetical protein